MEYSTSSYQDILFETTTTMKPAATTMELFFNYQFVWYIMITLLVILMFEVI